MTLASIAETAGAVGRFGQLGGKMIRRVRDRFVIGGAMIESIHQIGQKIGQHPIVECDVSSQMRETHRQLARSAFR